MIIIIQGSKVVPSASPSPSSSSRMMASKEQKGSLRRVVLKNHSPVSILTGVAFLKIQISRFVLSHLAFCWIVFASVFVFFFHSFFFFLGRVWSGKQLPDRLDTAVLIQAIVLNEIEFRVNGW
eukprot:TRINITY_DN15134_c2_g1_i1.p1 TRINITY_DN15134_c2_g1~~TRINITY_DN15134_c2_g1_i1.p1  ORF type:complete len:123 (+),score=10.77 TRINITY_DN15134_c2_g1_i1:365-733(+)